MPLGTVYEGGYNNLLWRPMAAPAIKGTRWPYGPGSPLRAFLLSVFRRPEKNRYKITALGTQTKGVGFGEEAMQAQAH